MKNSKLTKSILTVAAIALVVLSGPALGQEFTPDRDQVLEHP